MFRIGPVPDSPVQAPPRQKATVLPPAMLANCADAFDQLRQGDDLLVPGFASLPGMHPAAAPGPHSHT